LLAWVRVTAALEQVKALPEPFENLCGCEYAHARGRKLDCERQVVEPSAQLGDRRVPVDACARREQGLRVGLLERQDGKLRLTVDSQQCATRDQEAEVRTALQ
jgi:hypothetical protein